MAEKFRERAAAEPVERALPAIRREERELHSPLDSLGRGALHMRIPHEQTRRGGARAVSKADLDLRIASNFCKLRLEGSTSLPERFLRMLECIR